MKLRSGRSYHTPTSTVVRRTSRGVRVNRHTAAAAAGLGAAHYLYQKINSRFKPRIARSFTKTKTKERIQGSEGHSGIARTSLRWGHLTRRTRSYQKSTGTIQYKQTFNNALTSIAGRQNVYTVASVCSLNQFLISTAAPYQSGPGVVYNSQQNYFGLNPSRATTGGSTSVPQNPANETIYVRSSSISANFTNFGNVSVYADVYLLTPKRICAVNPDDSWSAGYSADSLGQAAISYPAAGTNNSTIGALDTQYPSARPRESVVFNKFWRVCKVKALNLSSSASETVNFDVKINKLVRRDYLLNLPAGTRYLPSLSYVVMVVVRGSLVIDLTGANDFNSTIGPVKLGHVGITSVRLNIPPASLARIREQSGVSNISTNSTLANERLVNEVDVNVPPVQA